MHGPQRTGSCHMHTSGAAYSSVPGPSEEPSLTLGRLQNPRSQTCLYQADSHRLVGGALLTVHQGAGHDHAMTLSVALIAISEKACKQATACSTMVGSILFKRDLMARNAKGSQAPNGNLQPSSCRNICTWHFPVPDRTPWPASPWTAARSCFSGPDGWLPWSA